MVRLTPRLVRRMLVPASCLVFLSGMLASGAIFYRGKPFDAKAAVLSDLQSPDDNPHGYGASAAGSAISAILLAPALGAFHERSRKGHPKVARAGTIIFAAGLGAAIGIGISAGTWVHLAAARAAPALLIFQFAALLLVVFLGYGPVDFNNGRLLTGLAFWEWVLCLDCGVALWALARIQDRDCSSAWRPA